MGETVRLTVVPNDGEAQILCGLLRVNGINSAIRASDLEIGDDPPGGYMFGGWREILVDAGDLARARELLPTKD